MLYPPSFPSVFPRLSLLTSSILLLRANICLALYCFEERPGLGPDPLHCRYALTHMPAIQTLGNSGLVNAHTSFVDPSRPFFPNAELRHGSCGIAFIVFDSTHEPPPSLKPTGQSVLRVWARMWAGTANIISQCVDHGTTGYTRENVNPVAPTDLPYAVIVFRTDGNDQWREDQRSAMEQNVVHRPFLFQRTFYDM